MINTTHKNQGSDYITVSDVSKTFIKQTGGKLNKKQEQLLVLKDIDFSVEEGEFVCIIGSSGCGKSTLLRIMSGLDTDHKGSVIISGEKVIAPKKERGMVFQEPRLFPWLNVEENVIFALNEGSDAEKKEKADAVIDLVDLSGFKHSLPKELSGGMAQRANIARALVNNPAILFLDEPFGALDAFTKMQLQDELLKIKKKEGTTMIMVTHDIEEAVYLSDRIIVMDKNPGRIRDIVTVDMPQPRNRNDYEFIQIRKEMFGFFFKSLGLPDLDPNAADTAVAAEPADAANTTGHADTAVAAEPADAANTTGHADTAVAADTTGPADTAVAAEPAVAADTAGPADAADTAVAADA